VNVRTPYRSRGEALRNECCIAAFVTRFGCSNTTRHTACLILVFPKLDTALIESSDTSRAGFRALRATGTKVLRRRQLAIPARGKT